MINNVAHQMATDYCDREFDHFKEKHFNNHDNDDGNFKYKKLLIGQMEFWSDLRQKEESKFLLLNEFEKMVLRDVYDQICQICKNKENECRKCLI